MKKIVSIIVLSAVLIGCQNQTPTLDTSNLEKSSPNLIENMSKEQKKTLPIDYKAPSTKTAIDSLPFHVNLPSKLPFETTPFKVQQLQDVRHDGKTVRVVFTAFHSEKDHMILISILATNEKTKIAGSKKKVNLKSNIRGYIQGDSIHFKKDGVTYDIGFTAENKSDISNIQLIDLANQMIK